MKASELRIGNLIGMILSEFPNNYFRVLEPATHSMKVTSDWIYYNNRSETDFYDSEIMDGIPLTEEWLLKFGFIVSSPGYWSKDKILIGYTTTEDNLQYEYLTGVGDSQTEMLDLKYVHQLQNLYFALTGNELIINV